MLIKSHRPTTPGLRGKVSVKAFVNKVKPDKGLTFGKRRISGRGGDGQISVRRRGGGHKRLYRVIDFKRDKRNIWGTVKFIEYDPNRSALIALVVYEDGEKRYVLATETMAVGQKIISSKDAKSEDGNCLPLENINIGSFIHNIEINLGRGGQMIRSAGAFARLLGKDGDYVSVELASGEVRKFFSKNCATIGVLSNKEKINENKGKAGKNRWLGKRPKVRGVAMNPVDHPMGGGEGKSSGGRHPCSPTGQKSKGLKTRSVKKYSDKFIIRKRKLKRRK
jgi:large subunit ribosomal protein L2